MTPAQALTKFGRLAEYIARRYVRPGVELDDLAQTAKLALVEACGTWDAERVPNFRLWASWKIRDALKRNTYARTCGYTLVSFDAPTDDDGQNLHERVGEAVEIEETLAIQEERARVRHMLERLPEADRALVDAWGSGASQEEIGRALGCAVRTAATKWSQTLSKVGRLLGHEKKTASARLSPSLTHSGRTQTLGAWARELGLQRQTLRIRLLHGWTVQAALTTPADGRRGRKPRKAA